MRRALQGEVRIVLLRANALDANQSKAREDKRFERRRLSATPRPRAANDGRTHAIFTL